MCAAPVKGRTEAGRRREERARETRRRITAAALELFLERGYAGTTVEAIATQASVAPATVYQAFATKSAVLAAALDVAIAGDTEPIAVLDRDWVKSVQRQPDARRRLERVVHHTSEIAARTAPIKSVIRDAAASEPGMRDLLRVDDERRRQTQEALVEVVLGTEASVDPRDIRWAADTFFALVNSDCYTLLARQLGWSLDDWRRWLLRMLERELITPTRGATPLL